MFYMTLTNDNTALFFNDSELNQMRFAFKFKSYCYPSNFVTFCFEAVITKGMRAFLKQFNVEIDEDESLLHFYLYKDGTIGRVLNR